MSVEKSNLDQNDLILIQIFFVYTFLKIVFSCL